MRRQSVLIVFIYLFGSTLLYSQILDTVIHTEKNVIHLKNITRKEFYKKKAQNLPLRQIVPLHKENGQFCIPIKNDIIFLNDTLNEDDPSFVEYNYIGFFDIINFYYFDVRYYEIAKFCIINQNTGNRYYELGEPIFSLNGEMMINASSISKYEPFPNVIQLWRIRNGEISLVVDFFPKDWVPMNVKWINENTVYFLIQYDNNKKKYAQLIIQ